MRDLQRINNTLRKTSLKKLNRQIGNGVSQKESTKKARDVILFFQIDAQIL
jgi:hypothetical protein